jgi:glycerophosphoryl diester phosphodiesterase
MIRFDQMSDWRRPMIIAHRGLTKIAHENTIEAFEMAINAGIDAIEFDVRRTVDDVLVIHHNKSLKKARRQLSRMTYSQALGLSQKQEYYIPTLEETLKLCSGRIALDVELKESGYEDEILSLVNQYYDKRNVIFTSFHDSSIAKIKQFDSKAIAGLLLGMRPQKTIRTSANRLPLINRLEKCNADFVAPNWRLLRLGFYRKLSRANLPIITWTVNDQRTANRLIRKQVTGIITDVPERLMSFIQ